MAWAAAIPAAIQIGTSIYDRMNKKDPTDRSFDFLNEAQSGTAQYFNPWIHSGQRAIPTLEEQYNSLINNPGENLARIGQDYQKSPGYEFGMQEGMNGINNAAAAGGTLGTSGHEYNAGQFATNFANKDFDNYLQRALGMYNTGLSGLQTQSTEGLGASTSMADMIKSILESKAKLAYAGAANQNSSNGGFMGSMGSIGGNMFSPGGGSGGMSGMFGGGGS